MRRVTLSAPQVEGGHFVEVVDELVAGADERHVVGLLGAGSNTSLMRAIESRCFALSGTVRSVILVSKYHCIFPRSKA